MRRLGDRIEERDLSASGERERQRERERKQEWGSGDGRNYINFKDMFPL